MKHSLSIPLGMNYEWGSNRPEDDTAEEGFVYSIVQARSVTQGDNVKLCMSRGQMLKARRGEKVSLCTYTVVLN